MKKMYPVIFTQTSNDVLVEVPDLGILTQGTDIENAFEMARDAISITIVSKEDNHEAISAPTKINAIDLKHAAFAKEGESFTSIVDVDIVEYRKRIDTRPVRRNVSLPCWLNHEADLAGINVSRVLQEALINVLGLTNRH